MQGPVSVRTLLRSPAASEPLLWREFLPGVPVSPVLPGALRLFRNDLEEADLPFRDGAVFMSSSLRDVLDVSSEALYTDLKWNGEKGRAVGILLHQVMLMAALEARRSGAAALGWRLAVPDEMAQEGRERLAETLRDPGGPGLPGKRPSPAGKEPPVAFASGKRRPGRLFPLLLPGGDPGRLHGAGSGSRHGGSVPLPAGAGGGGARLPAAPWGCTICCCPPCCARPGSSRRISALWRIRRFRRDLADLQTLLERARRDPAALRQARYGLDA